jgi:hypothetical protein
MRGTYYFYMEVEKDYGAFFPKNDFPELDMKPSLSPRRLFQFLNGKSLKDLSKLETLTLVSLIQVLSAFKGILIVYMILSLWKLELSMFLFFILLEVSWFKETTRLDLKASLGFFTLLATSWLARVSTAAFYHSMLVENDEGLNKNQKIPEFGSYLTWTFPLIVLESFQGFLVFIVLRAVCERERSGLCEGLSWKFALREIIFRMRKKNSLIF